MPEVRRPRRGSLAYYPRKRAKRIYPRVKTIAKSEKVKPLLFAGYKVGMTTVKILDNKKGSPSFGQEIAVPATIIDCPPLKIIGIRAYTSTPEGLKVFSESYCKDLPKDLKRKVKINSEKTEKNLEKIESNLEKLSNIRLIVSTQPRISGLRKRKPEVFEVELGGDNIKEKIEFYKQNAGKEIYLKDVIKEGEFVDVIAVTKGKGTEGPVKRWGVKIQNRHAKQKLRHVGAIASQTPRRVRWTAPMAGQLGFQTRTELNKWVLKIGEDGKEINPKGGFKRYGLVPKNYVLIEGSVPGPKKRLIMIRSAVRANRLKYLTPEVREIVK